MSDQPPESIRSRLVLALDVPDRAAALKLVEQLTGCVGMFKIGLQLFTAEGPDLVREIVEAGERVFLDLKFHDIPNTVSGAARSAARLGVSLFNVHALGGRDMMRAAARAASEIETGADRRVGHAQPAVLGVTVLTSMNASNLEDVGVTTPEVSSAVVRLARLARQSGLDGVVASPREIRPIREQVAPAGFIIVTPGIRPSWSEGGDQQRVATPAQAIRDGADYIVVGRPIIADPDPRAAALRILEEIEKNR